jgi:MFS family permease
LLADRWNRRNLIALALATWSGMTALSGFAANIVHLTLARIGVGVGEAGCSPPAHSMIADLYGPRERSTAMGVFTLGISGGIMIAYLAGGWVAENIGWREAFLIVGLPGLVLALLVRFTISEPVRGQSDGKRDTTGRPGIITVARFLLDRKSFLHLAVGSGLASFIGYAVLSFFPTFLYRSHGMNVSEIGVWLGIILGTAGGLGFAGGGYIADRLGRGGQRYALRGVAGATMIAWLFNFPVLLSGNPYLALGLFVVPSIFSNFYLATTFAQVQGLVGLRMRAVASALLLFILNSVGLGLGPLFAGALSDMFDGPFGAESMRYSLLFIAAVIGPWSAFHYLAASRHIEGDLSRSDEVH